MAAMVRGLDDDGVPLGHPEEEVQEYMNDFDRQNTYVSPTVVDQALGIVKEVKQKNDLIIEEPEETQESSGEPENFAEKSEPTTKSELITFLDSLIEEKSD